MPAVLPSPFLSGDKLIVTTASKRLNLGDEVTVDHQDADGDIYTVELDSKGERHFVFQDDATLADGRIASNPEWILGRGLHKRIFAMQHRAHRRRWWAKLMKRFRAATNPAP